MPDTGDRELARLFAELRRSDAAATPPFQRVLDRPRDRRVAPGVRRPAFVALLAAAALLTAALVQTVLHRTSGDGIPSLAEWRSPTAFLLRTPGSELLEQPRSFVDLSEAEAGLERSSARPRPSRSPASAGPRNKGDRP